MKDKLLKVRWVAVMLMIFFFSACKEDQITSKAQDEKEIKLLRQELEKMSTAEVCTNAADWKFVPLGSQACGGAVEFITYSIKINTNQFLQKVEEYNTKQKAFNAKYNVVSPCAMILPPKSVDCVDGKPKFVY